MDLDPAVIGEVQEALVPGARQALKIPLSYKEFRQYCLQTYILTAVKECGGNQNRAAMKIGADKATVSRVVHNQPFGGSPARSKKQPEQK